MLEGLEPPENLVYSCKVDLLKHDLSPEDYEILLTAVYDTRKWGAKTLQKALRERNISLSDTVIGKHRHKQCACFRGA